MKIINNLFILLAIFVLSSILVMGVNPITNPDFETGNFSGWTANSGWLVSNYSNCKGDFCLMLNNNETNSLMVNVTNSTYSISDSYNLTDSGPDSYPNGSKAELNITAFAGQNNINISFFAGSGILYQVINLSNFAGFYAILEFEAVTSVDNNSIMLDEIAVVYDFNCSSLTNYTACDYFDCEWEFNITSLSYQCTDDFFDDDYCTPYSSYNTNSTGNETGCLEEQGNSSYPFGCYWMPEDDDCMPVDGNCSTRTTSSDCMNYVGCMWNSTDCLFNNSVSLGPQGNCSDSTNYTDCELANCEWEFRSNLNNTYVCQDDINSDYCLGGVSDQKSCVQTSDIFGCYWINDSGDTDCMPIDGECSDYNASTCNSYVGCNYTGVDFGCQGLNVPTCIGMSESNCWGMNNCYWDSNDTQCYIDCQEYDNSTSELCVAAYDGNSCGWNSIKMICDPLGSESLFVDCYAYDNNETECNATSDCTWNSEGTGFCDIDCMQHANTTETTCAEAFDGNTCGYDNATGDCKPGIYDGWFDSCFMCHQDCDATMNDTYTCHDTCDTEEYCQGGTTTFNYCFFNDGNETGCNTNSNCIWMPDPGCTTEYDCYDPVAPGYCNSINMDFSTGGTDCIQYDGDEDSCNNAVNFGTPCIWEFNPMYTGIDNDTGWCNSMFGGTQGCWQYDNSEENCNASADMGMPCIWKDDTYNPNGGWCEQQGCWSHDGNETACNASILNCIYDTGICYEDFSAGCGAWLNDQGCYGTNWCFWNTTSSICTEPVFDPGVAAFFNPGCWIFDGNQSADKCTNVTTCDWNGASELCEDDGADTANGVQCSDINNSEICGKIPMLSTCCAWNGTTCNDAPMTTQCWDQMQEAPEGAMFCKDYLAYENETMCNLIASDPWYMPCEWNTTTTTCGFKFDDMFANVDPHVNMGFDLIGSQANCEAAGGFWKVEQWSDALGIHTDTWCEMSFGFGKQSCNDVCWACEYDTDGSNWTDKATAKSECLDSNANSTCVFHADNYSMNGFGWCDINFTAYKDNFNFTAFVFEDCMGFYDMDGDGLLPSEDPDCMDFMQFGFIPIEAGYECGDNIDNDGNGLTDCDDFSCMYDTYYCTVDSSNDNESPIVTWFNEETFMFGAFVGIDTNEPTNATILFYKENTTCEDTSIVLKDFKLMNDWELDDYDMWHDIPIDEGIIVDNGESYSINLNTTYYYKTNLCDRNGNCALSACNNFTTGTEAKEFVIGFEMPPIMTDDLTGFLGNFNVQFDFDGNGNFGTNITGAAGTKINETQGMGVDLKFSNPTASEPWSIYFIGADLLAAQDLNISDAFVVNDTADGDNVFVGMKKDKWTELAQKLGVDKIKITIPQNLADASRGALKHCPDNATSIDDADCIDLSATDVDCTFTTTQSVCEIPTNIGFSVFAVYMAETVQTPSSSSSSGGGGGSSVNIAGSDAANGPTHSAMLTSVTAGEEVSIKVSNEEMDVTEIKFETLNELGSVDVSIQSLGSKPSSVDTVPKAYKFIEITKSGMKNSDIKEAAIGFKVESSWMSDEGFSKNDIALFRWVDDSWTELETKYLKTDGDIEYFEAVTPGFSYFAIAPKEEVVKTLIETTDAVATDETVEETNPKKTTEVTTTEKSGEVVQGTQEQEKPTPFGIYIGVAVIILALAAYLVFVLKKK